MIDKNGLAPQPPQRVSAMSYSPLQVPGTLIARLRRERNLSANELARLVGTTQQTIGRIENGEIVHSKHLRGITEVLGITAEMLADDTAPPPGLQVFPIEREADPTLPLYVNLGRVNANTFRCMKCGTYKIRRPHMLKGKTDAYATLMPDDSMVPEFRAGDTLMVVRSAPPRLGRSHVFRNMNSGDFKVRQLIEKNRDHYLVKAHSADNDGDADSDRVPITWEAHLIAGFYQDLEI